METRRSAALYSSSIELTTPRSSRVQDRWIVAALLLVLAIVLTAMAGLWRYKSTPGAQGSPPFHWPAASRLVHHTGRGTLLVFAHPMCTCTDATLTELRDVFAHAGRDVDATLVVAAPPVPVSGWDEEGMMAKARAFPTMHVVHDVGATEARVFDVLTSGEVLFYDARGALRFRGGITGSRGHVGDNLGVQRLLKALRTQSSAPRAPVFGCPLEDEP